MSETVRLLYHLGKLRIGFAITLCALAGVAVTPGAAPGVWAVAVLAVAVLLSSASAGAFNQYVERDLDARMHRTRQRPFVTGRFVPGWRWPAGMAGLLVVAVGAAALATNAVAATHVLLGAVTYGVVYTVWLKRRTWLNIVLGGLAGSFAVLAGAAAVDPHPSAVPALLAVVLFLWTPPHFWSLAFAYRGEYAQAGVPMLPAVVSPQAAAWVIFGHTVTLVALSLAPAAFGLGAVYLAGAVLGGFFFVRASWRLVREPSVKNAMANFRASLVQLSLVLGCAILDPALGA